VIGGVGEWGMGEWGNGGMGRRVEIFRPRVRVKSGGKVVENKNDRSLSSRRVPRNKKKQRANVPALPEIKRMKWPEENQQQEEQAQAQAQVQAQVQSQAQGVMASAPIGGKKRARGLPQGAVYGIVIGGIALIFLILFIYHSMSNRGSTAVTDAISAMF